MRPGASTPTPRWRRRCISGDGCCTCRPTRSACRTCARWCGRWRSPASCCCCGRCSEARISRWTVGALPTVATSHRRPAMADRPRLTTADFHPEVLRLFDQYVHGAIDRRAFLAGAGRFAVGAMTATGLLAALSPRFAEARQVEPTDARIDARSIEFDSPQGYGRGRGYLVRPAQAAGPLPAVLVIHENRGLNPHIEDVARRFALAGYIAFAPDALHPLGGYPGDEDAARAKFATLDA